MKYCLVLNNDYMIEEKKTLKGYVNKTISIEDYIKLEVGYTIENKKQRNHG